MDSIYMTALCVGSSLAVSSVCGFLMGLWVSPARKNEKKRGVSVEIRVGGEKNSAQENPKGKSDLDFFATSIGAPAPAEHMQKNSESTCEHICAEKIVEKNSEKIKNNKKINNNIFLKVKKINKSAQLPARATAGSAGYDLFAVAREYLPTEGRYVYGTGVAVEIPTGYCGLLFARSSVSARLLRPSHAVGVIDCDYRGELRVCYDERQGVAGLPPYEVGERVGQLVLVPCAMLPAMECETLSDTARGAGGFGSTGV